MAGQGVGGEGGGRKGHGREGTPAAHTQLNQVRAGCPPAPPVFATRILAFSMRLGCPTPMRLSKMKPSSRNESCRGGRAQKQRDCQWAHRQAPPQQEMGAQQGSQCMGTSSRQLRSSRRCGERGATAAATFTATAVAAFEWTGGRWQHSGQRCSRHAGLDEGNQLPTPTYHPAHLDGAPWLLDDLDCIQVGAALEPQHRIHRQLSKVALLCRGQRQGEGRAAWQGAAKQNGSSLQGQGVAGRHRACGPASGRGGAVQLSHPAAADRCQHAPTTHQPA